jgi:hypothetical protein
VRAADEFVPADDSIVLSRVPPDDPVVRNAKLGTGAKFFDGVTLFAGLRDCFDDCPNVCVGASTDVRVGLVTELERDAVGDEIVSAGQAAGEAASNTEKAPSRSRNGASRV